MLRLRVLILAVFCAVTFGQGDSLSRSLALRLPASQALSRPYSNHEGVLAPGHDHALDSARQEYFLTDDKLDLWKLERAREFLLEQKRLVEASAKLNRKTNLIWEHGYSEKDGEKKGREALSSDAESLAPYLFALESIEDLRANHSKYDEALIREKIETTLLWIAEAYTVHPIGLFTSFVERAKNLIENFFDFDVNDTQSLQASNLLHQGRFASQEELQRLRLAGTDLSTLDPPSSAIWTNNEVESYDPEAEVYFNRRLFPPREDALPTVYYTRFGNGQVKFKGYWLDTAEIGKKGKPTKKNVTLRVGWESYTATVVNHLARAIGYPANPTAARPRVKLVLGDTTFEEFLSQYERIHGNEQGSPVSHIERVRGENAVILKNVTIEAYPDEENYHKIGPFRMGDNGLRNRREYRAMVLYNSLISLQDEFEYQSRVDAYRDPVTGEWRPLFFLSDTSSALGLPAFLGNKGTVNEFTWRFTKRSDTLIRLFWLSVFDSRTWHDTTYSDVKWLARRMARLRSAQIDSVMNTSGFPEPVRVLYAEKFKSRLNQMIRDFDLEREGYSLHPVLSPQELAQRYPQYIDEKGFLKEGAQEIPGNTLPILGNRFTPYQGIIVMGINALQSEFLKLFSPGKIASALGGKAEVAFNLGPMASTAGVLFDATRHVNVNQEYGAGQKRYLLRDKVAISIPIGMMNDRLVTPAALYYTYSFEYAHSVTTMLEVGTSRFFDLINPFSIEQIRRKLGMGEQLRVTQTLGASIGNFKVKASEDLKVEASLLGLSYEALQSQYYSRTSEDLLEIAVNSNTNFEHRTGIDLRAIVHLGAMLSNSKSKSKYRLYRIDLLNHEEVERQELEEAFEKAIVFNDYGLLDQKSPARYLNEDTVRNSGSFNFFFWTFNTGSSSSDLDVNGTPVFLATDFESSDRAFERLWDGNVELDEFRSVLNIPGRAWNQGEFLDIGFEGLASTDLTRFQGMELNISAAKTDNYCTREEFDNDFRPFFNSRSGKTPYFDFEMPKGLDQYLELQGTMRWQLSAAAIRDILGAASDWKNLEHLVPRRQSYEQQPVTDPREEVSFRAIRAQESLDPTLPLEKRRKILRERARDIVFVVKKLIGDKGERLANLRNFTPDEKIWVLTSISGMLDLSHPAFRTTKGQLYFAPEIGKYQGRSFLQDFRRKNQMQLIYRQM